MNTSPCHWLANEIEIQTADLALGLESWLTDLADQLDEGVDAFSGPVEDLIDRARDGEPLTGGDELAIGRADRATLAFLQQLAGVSGALRLGPPTDADRGLRALAQALRARSLPGPSPPSGD